MAARAEVGRVGDDDLKARALEFGRGEAVMAGGEGHALAELDVRGTTDRQVGMRTAAWLAREAGAPPAAAKREVKTARKLRERFGLIDRAVMAGELSAHHAAAVVGLSNPRVEAALAD